MTMPAAAAARQGAHWLAACALLLGTACGTGGNPPAAAAPVDVAVLVMGNSHASMHELPQQLAQLLQAGLAGRSVGIAEAPGWLFLDERLHHAPSQALLRSRTWTVVVLQAQKYSSSGQFTHPTAPAVALVRQVRSGGATPVLFPEWPRRGVDETQRILGPHLAIAQEVPACVAPIGQAWDLALQRHPALALHAADGNHASAAGAYLTALVLYATITGATPLGTPALANGLTPEVQAQLRRVAADTVQAVDPRQLCPNDPPLTPR
jgi:hypothetical protein